MANPDKVVCLHHDDLDGKCAAAIVNLYYSHVLNIKSIYFVACNYNMEFDFTDDLYKKAVVVIVDFSLKPDKMQELRRVAKNVIWIDHHKSAKDYPYQDLAGLRDYTDKGRSGCQLAWDYYFPLVEVPRFVQLISDYDTYTLKYQPSCFEFYEGLKIEDNRPESDLWLKLLDQEDLVDEIIKSGKICIQYRNNWCKELRDSYGFETTFEGYKCYCLNISKVSSKGAFTNEIMKKYDICISFIYDGNCYNVLLYSSKVDTSEIAKKYGGGGHKLTSGFTITELPFKRL